MSARSPSAPMHGFRSTLIAIGVFYALMAWSAIIQGAEVLHQFGVAPELTAEPVFADFFSFFYEFMAIIGLLTVVLGCVAKDRRSQGLSASVLCLANLRIGFRDLATSDSPWGNRLYEGEGTLLFVCFDALLVLVFGFFAWRGLRQS